MERANGSCDSRHVLTVTTYFPNSSDRHRAVFIENLVKAMRLQCKLTVVSPVPYAPPFPWVKRWHSQRGIRRQESVGDIDVLHPRFLAIPKLGWLSGIGYFLGTVSLLRKLKRQYGRCVIHAHSAFPDGVGVALVARLLRLPYVITVHGSDINIYAGRWILATQISWALRGAAGVVAVSRDLQQKVIRLTNGSIRRLTCIPCAGFDPATFYSGPSSARRASLDISPGARVVVFVGQLVPVKGLEYLIEAWTILHEQGTIQKGDLLVIIGEGPCRADLEMKIERGGISSLVLFTGGLRQVDVSRWVGASSILCLPSINEGTPNVIVEALATGVPVVATRVGGVPELVIDGSNGILVAPQNAAELANGLAVALAREWDSEKLSRSVAHLTWQAIAARNCEFLDFERDLQNAPMG